MNDNVPQHSLLLMIDSSIVVGWPQLASGWLIFFFVENKVVKKRSVSAGLLTRLTQFFGLLQQNECGSQLINCPKIYTYKKDNDPLFQSKLQSISKFGSSNSLCFTNWWTSLWMSKKYHLLSEKQVISREMAKMSALIKSVKDWSGL